MSNLDAQIAATTKKLEQQLRRQAIAEYAAKERERKATRKIDADARKADAHRKITLGGLVIAAGVDGWDEAEIVGGLLALADSLASHPDRAASLRERGIQHMEAREAARKAKR